MGNKIEKYIWDTGSTWMPIKEAKTDEKEIIRLESEKHVVVSRDGNYITTPRWDKMENEVASELLRLSLISPCKKFSERRIHLLIDEYVKEKNGGMKFHHVQEDAIIMIVNNNLSVLIGGPGTGKTTVLKAAAYVLRRLKWDTSITFAAPTGKAARRIEEVTKEHASTLHSKFRLGLGEAEREASELEEDVLFIDEYSMNGLELTLKVSKAITIGKKIVFVGDSNQLMSVEPGAVLRDLVVSKVFPVTILTKTFRQDNQSALFEAITAIKEGRSNLPCEGSFRAFERTKNMNVEQMMVASYKNAVKEYGAEQVVMLLPYRRKGFCTNSLNSVLQRELNPRTQGFRHHSAKDKYICFFKQGDFVMQMENRTDCVNGEVGQVVEVNKAGIKVSFVDNQVFYSSEDMEQLSLAYATTIHKSQGSEYAAVLMALFDSHEKMLSNNILYTGVTRAKKYCELYYDKTALETALKTRGKNLRKTCLCEKLISLRNQYKFVYGI